jgi:hypothetical protein
MGDGRDCAFKTDNGGVPSRDKLTTTAEQSFRSESGGTPWEGKMLQSSEPKRTWDKDQWDRYYRMPWMARRLADLMALFPRFGGWLMRPAWRVED